MDPIVIDVRSAGPADGVPLVQLHEEAWRLAYRGIIPALTLERMIVRRTAASFARAPAAGGAVLVVTFGDTIAGYASIGRARSVVAHCTGEIYELYLKPEYQGVGLGRRLFSAARRKLAAGGHQGHVVWALAANEQACAFYAAHGGRPSCHQSEALGGASLEKIAFCWR